MSANEFLAKLNEHSSELHDKWHNMMTYSLRLVSEEEILGEIAKANVSDRSVPNPLTVHFKQQTLFGVEVPQALAKLIPARLPLVPTSDFIRASTGFQEIQEKCNAAGVEVTPRGHNGSVDLHFSRRLQPSSLMQV